MDEETAPLLPAARPQKRTPLPKAQLAILMVLMLAEPIACLCISPFINELVATLPITGGDPAKVGYYAGLIQSLFFATEAIFILYWSSLSDRIGRKPVLLLGISGLGISMIFFGLSKSFVGLVLSRCFVGLTNGNVGVMKSMIGDLTDSTNVAQAFAWIPVTWATGVTLGPFMGGMLSRPYNHWPEVFSHPFWREYPYFLPCLVASCFCGCAFVTTVFFLNETVTHSVEPSHARPAKRRGSCGVVDAEARSAAVSQGESSISLLSQKQQPSTSIRDVLVRPVIVSIANYACLAILDIAFQALQPLFYATPRELGGLGLSPRTIGAIMGSYGIVNGIFQATCFAKIVHRFGLKRVFFAGIASLVPIFALFPVISVLAGRYGLTPWIWLLVVFQVSLMMIMELSFGTIFIFVTNAAPSKRTLGATNGLAQTVASAVRAIGPASSTSLFAFSVSRNILGGYAAYLVLVILSVASLFVANLFPTNGWKSDEDERQE